MKTTTYRHYDISVTDPRPTSTGVRDGLDLDVEVHLPDGRVLTGEVTLVPRSDGVRDDEMRPYGSSPEQWISGALLKELDALADDDVLRDLADAASCTCN